MLGSFKIRMLVVIVIAAMAGLSMQSDHSSKQVVRPMLGYIMKDYDVEKNLALFIENLRDIEPESIPTTGNRTLQIPCEFVSIERSYGWYWNQDAERQEFYPGISLNVKEKSIVKPVLSGEVYEISGDIECRKVVIKHNDDYYSEYSGLSEVLVNEKDFVNSKTIIGKTGERLDFQVTNQDGPLNPNDLFTQ